MNNPLLELGALPDFGRIEARHARPALAEVLAQNRARLAELTAQETPTFASLVVPVEELSYRLSRVFSPISHLNAVANSTEMREAYNECVPLLTEYSSELGQNAALQAAYAHILTTEGEALDPSQRKLLENALRDFRLAGVDLPADRKPATAKWRSAWRSWRPSFPRTCSTRGAPIPAASPIARSSPVCPATPSIAPRPMHARPIKRVGCSSSTNRPI